MLDFDDDASRREKCFTTIAQLPAFVDPKQPPTKKSPFSAIANHSFVHTVEAILPEEVYSSIKDSLDAKVQKLRYARVFMSPSALLEGDFFNTYIKTGNILMISEGLSGSDNVYTLKDGILKLELGKEVYERTGLTGKPIRSGGRKHAKERYLVEINLRLPSMLHGKKGFDRIVWAFKNVLDHSVAWLFYDLAPGTNGISEGDPTLKGNHPQIIDCDVSRTNYRNIITPSFCETTFIEASSENILKDDSENLCEWLAMVALGSPRVSKDDNIDPYLSRYSVPDNAPVSSTDLVSLKWHGFVPASWILDLFITVLRETASKSSLASTWFALSSSALGREAVEANDGYTIMLLPRSECPDSTQDNQGEADTPTKTSRSCICWEYVGASVL
ncbi:hypothetical protein IFM58399_00132 [Aspergillus lentulus]|uniref:Uncharacterized protein n=1 Tax=Aspergillus lentulus TaxID=293939 RepID=A0ABQ0ZQV2_ASPLE|nr:uncharacterized protein IFM58399_00132 [Aspergillus lentulus]GFF23004.1 hypothetical protein IFM58399_00132 [Aspergillus lentulus]GFF61075.1 hypothetical protein IFM60648_00132 [Aspergillus lentulus]GFF62634.1 hypothetical protein IFM47457_00136 [Aspergillus lentulus]GFF69447.1 hypothetical protein IFM62136_07593 [Aspergillus lentulus]GFF98158.1 hypothetical protein IFM61392_00132 [Aspergillus lentulus]